MPTIKRSIWINAPVTTVNEIARDPEHWGHWYAGLSDPKEVNGTGEVGTAADYTYEMIGMHFPVTIVVNEDFISPSECRWTGLIHGPLAGRLHCLYLAKDGGTEATFEIEYTVPGKVLSLIINSLIVERIEENALEHTLQNLKVLCELK